MVEKHYRRKEIETLTGLSRSTIYDLMTKGKFPRPIKLTGRVVGWQESAVAAWLAERAKVAA